MKVIQEMKNIVLITDVDFWHEGAGHRMRIAALVKFISRHVNLFVIYFGKQADSFLIKFVQNFSFQIEHFEIKGNSLTKSQNIQIRKYVIDNKIEVAIIEYIYLTITLEILPPEIIYILDAHDIASDRASSFRKFNYRDTGFEMSRKTESQIFDLYDYILLMSKSDVNTVRKICKSTIPIFCPHPARSKSRRLRKRVLNIGFIGSEYVPNYDAVKYFVNECWPSINKENKITFSIYGNVTKTLKNVTIPKGVRLVGFVDNLEDIYKEIDIMVNPVRFGAGVKIKNIETLANGIPLVTTTHGATGLEEVAGDAFLVGNSTHEFCNHIKALVSSHFLRVRIGNLAFNFANSLTPEKCFESLLKIIIACN